MENTYYYSTEVRWTGARRGILNSEGMQEIEIASPPEFKGEPYIWAPEHLFVASVNICLMTTFLAIADLSKLPFNEYFSGATGKLEKVDGKYMVSEIVLKPKIIIPEERHRDRCLRIIEKSEANCLISNSIKTKVIIEPEIKVKTI
ncbi:MAG: OsmC family protein [Ignavibacteria bacterium]